MDHPYQPVPPRPTPRAFTLADLAEIRAFAARLGTEVEIATSNGEQWATVADRTARAMLVVGWDERGRPAAYLEFRDHQVATADTIAELLKDFDLGLIGPGALKV